MTAEKSAILDAASRRASELGNQTINGFGAGPDKAVDQQQAAPMNFSGRT
jgi:hypothetical protein